MITQLVATLDRTLAFIREQVADLPDEEMVRQPAGVPNHAAWTIGHVIYSCQEMAAELGTESWLPADWESNFGYGSSPGQSIRTTRPGHYCWRRCVTRVSVCEPLSSG